MTGCIFRAADPGFRSASIILYSHKNVKDNVIKALSKNLGCFPIRKNARNIQLKSLLLFVANDVMQSLATDWNTYENYIDKHVPDEYTCW